jgi:hypothetical protein
MIGQDGTAMNTKRLDLLIFSSKTGQGGIKRNRVSMPLLGTKNYFKLLL